MRLERGLHPFLDGAHGFEVLVEFHLILRAGLAADGFGFVHDEIEDAGAVALQRIDDGGMIGVHAGNDGRGGVAIEAVEGQLGNDFLEHGRVGIAPGDERAVHAREASAGVIDTGAGGFEAQFEGGQHGFVADAFAGDLIDRSAAGVEILTAGALDISAREPGRNFDPMPAAADGLLVPEIAENEDVVPEGFERLEMPGEFEVFAVSRRVPEVRAHAVGHEEEGHAHGWFGELRLACGGSGLGHGFEPWQRHCGAGAA